MVAKLDWAGVLAFAAQQPNAEQTSFYGQPAVKVNGVAIVTAGREPDSFALHAGHDLKQLLLETDPATFWQTPHYASSAWLLVRLNTTDPARVRDHIAAAAGRALQAKPKKRKT